MTERRLAALDLGTNSARLLVGDVSQDGAWSLVVDERIPCRLGQDLARTGRLHPEAEERAERALSELAARARGAGARRLVCVATYALRAAANGARFVERVRQSVGIELRLLSGEEEARLVLRAARRYVTPAPGERVLCLDLGGGSLELARDDPGAPALVSLPLGPVVAGAALQGSPAPGVVAEFRGEVAGLLRAGAAGFSGSSREPAAAGGTATSAARLLGARGPLAGRALAAADLESLLPRLAALDLEMRRRLPGLPPDRADIIVPGLAVLCETLRFLGAAGLRVHEHGVREGVLLAMQAGEM